MIPFNRPYMTGKELWYIAQAHAKGHLAGDGSFTKLCNQWIEQRTGSSRALLTHSCTAALEMAALLADLRPGDEVIMPDEKLVEAAITPKTRAIVPVHYAGVACEMDAIGDIARRYELLVIEDAAQAVMSSYKGRPLGAIGDLGAVSFHETKNVISGEGGALLVNHPRFAERAEIIREKGTNRSQFFRGQVDKYTWVDVGSSFLPGEIIAAFLWAQMEEVEAITRRRLAMWGTYHQWFVEAERAGRLRRPIVPGHCVHNAHMYYILLPDLQRRTAAIDKLKTLGVHSVFHYVPLHSAPAGLKYGRAHGEMRVTDDVADRLLRLPMWVGLEDHQTEVIQAVLSVL